MRILYVNWAPLWLGAKVGAGVNIYTQSMAVEMVKKGHQVYSISSGYAYNLLSLGLYLKRGPDYKGVINYEIFNAPNLAPGFFNYESPQNDVTEPKVEAVFREFIRQIKPDIIHFQNIEGFSAKSISIAKEFEIKVIYSLHNYHPVCNQVFLLYKDNEICYDFNNGNKCVECISPPPLKREFRKRKIAYIINKLPKGEFLWHKSKKLYYGVFFSYLKQIYRAIRPFLLKKRVEQFQDNDQIKYSKKQSAQMANFYSKRRVDNICEINKADVILAVSTFVKDLYLKMGVKPDGLHVNHIGSAMAEIGLKKSSEIAVKRDNEKINVVFLGNASYPKGLSFFLKTLNRVKPDYLSKIRLYIYAKDAWSLSQFFKPVLKKLSALEVFDGYQYESLPDILKKMDIGVVPPLWWDNAPQVVFEMFSMKVPVIGANIGGIPDFVNHGENGLLFIPGDMADLSDKIQYIIENPNIIEKFKKNIVPMKTIKQHADELELYYQA